MKFLLNFYLYFFILLVSSNAKKEKISIQLDWLHQFQFAGYYIAKEKGLLQRRKLRCEN
ncbi:MAG: hypothetical protein ACNI22_04850 [Halarcobacter sp.]